MGKLTIRREGAWEAFALPLSGMVDGEEVCRLMNFGTYTCERAGEVTFTCCLRGRAPSEPLRLDLDAHEAVTVTVLQVPGASQITVEPPEAVK